MRDVDINRTNTIDAYYSSRLAVTTGPPATHKQPVTKQSDVTEGQQHTLTATYRRSFLEALLARQNNKPYTRDNSAATDRVLNPVNYVPRPTPVRFQGQDRAQDDTEIAETDAHNLLTLQEQRRSRHNSPQLPIVENLTNSAPGSRTSIGLPANQQRSPVVLPQTQFTMAESEKSPPPVTKKPEKAHIPTSKYNTKERDLEANQPAQSILGSTYGASPGDNPSQPPRQVASHRSLRQTQSISSLHGSVFMSRTNLDQAPPVPPLDLTQYEGAADNTSTAEELAWGPSHPCFPHMNPHVPLNSPAYTATRVIRIRRDWMVVGDLAPTFTNIYPEILDPLLQEQEFRSVIQHINRALVDAYDPFSSSNWLDGFLGVITGWLWEDFRPNGTKGKLRALEKWLEDWNHSVGTKEGVKIISLRRTGYMNLDIQIPDPQVKVITDGEEDEEGGNAEDKEMNPNRKLG